MNEWMEVFISQCLTDVPPGKYRARTEKELRDHMQTQLRFLSEAEALQVMGDPERLRKEYKAAWARTFQARTVRGTRCTGVIAGGCLIMGTLYICTALFLAMLGFTTDSTSASLISLDLPMTGGSLALTIFGSALFLVPFPLGALYLRSRFPEERRTLWITAGLLAAWAGEKAAIILLSALIYEMPLSLDLLHRISQGGDVTGPWFTPTYILLTFVGCLVLGQLFGRKMERSRELA